MHMQARWLRERFCADIQPDAVGDVYWRCVVGSRFIYPPRHER